MWPSPPKNLTVSTSHRIYIPSTSSRVRVKERESTSSDDDGNFFSAAPQSTGRRRCRRGLITIFWEMFHRVVEFTRLRRRKLRWHTTNSHSVEERRKKCECVNNQFFQYISALHTLCRAEWDKEWNFPSPDTRRGRGRRGKFQFSCCYYYGSASLSRTHTTLVLRPEKEREKEQNLLQKLILFFTYIRTAFAFHTRNKKTSIDSRNEESSSTEEEKKLYERKKFFSYLPCSRGRLLMAVCERIPALASNGDDDDIGAWDT